MTLFGALQKTVGATCSLLLVIQSPVLAACGITDSFRQADVEVINGARQVLQRKVLYDANVVVFSEAMKVNTDGALRSYSVVDPGGRLCDPDKNPGNASADPMQLGCAMNTICNGMNVIVPKPGGGMQSIKGNENCSRVIQEFNRIKVAPGWRPADGSRIEPFAIEMQDSHQPCLNASGRFMVSMASTLSGAGGGACTQGKYLDALVPSIVVPKCWSRTYSEAHATECATHLPAGVRPDLSSGDLVALAPRRGGAAIFAVIGDTGPNRKLGEASVGLLMKTAGRAGPRHLYETYRLDGQPFHVVIFRNSTFAGTLTLGNVADMESQARAKFVAWTGSATASLEKLKACGMQAMH